MAPVVVSGEGNDVAPVAALSGDHLLIAWVRDNGIGPDNMDIVYRIVGTDGVPIGDAERVLETTRAGKPVAGNAMYAAVAALPDGFLIAGARAGDEMSTFQVFVQELDADGELVGEAADAGLEPGVTQVSPAVAAGADGTTWLAWVRENGDETQVVVRPLDGVATAEPAFADVAASDTPALAVDPEDPTRVWVAATVNRRVRIDVMVTDVGQPLADRTALALGESRDTEHTPALLAWAGGGAALFHRVVGGIRNEVVLQSFGDEAGTLEADPEVSLARESPAGPYPYGLASLGPGVVFAAWSDGTSPAFRLRGRFALLP